MTCFICEKLTVVHANIINRTNTHLRISKYRYNYLRNLNEILIQYFNKIVRLSFNCILTVKIYFKFYIQILIKIYIFFLHYPCIDCICNCANRKNKCVLYYNIIPKFLFYDNSLIHIGTDVKS